MGTNITKLARDLRKKKIKEIFKCEALVNREVVEFKKWFNKNYGYSVEDAKSTAEVVTAIYGFTKRDFELHIQDMFGVSLQELSEREKAPETRRMAKRVRKRIERGDVINKDIDWQEQLLERGTGIMLSWNNDLRRKSGRFFVGRNTMLGEILETRTGLCVVFSALFCAIAEELGIEEVKPFLVTRQEEGKRLRTILGHVAVSFVRAGRKHVYFDSMNWVQNVNYVGEKKEKEFLLAAALSVKGALMEKPEEREDALELQNKALEIDPNFMRALIVKGTILNKLERYQEALKSSEKCLTIDSKDPMSWNNKGTALEGLDKWESALKCYDKALKVAPDYVSVLNNKGNLLNKFERFEEALDCFNSALKEIPEHAGVLNGKGVALMKLGKKQEAVKCFDEALSYAPDDKEIIKNLENAKKS